MARNDYDLLLDGSEVGGSSSVPGSGHRKGLGKRMIIGFGVTVGIISSLVGMLPNSRTSEAAIAVIDQQNIEQAIETAIKTAEILTTEQKELLLMLMNLKKIDASFLGSLMQKYQQKTTVWDEQDKVTEGILRKASSVDSVWTSRMGDLEDVLNGNITITGAVMNEAKRNKVKDETSKSAAEVARLAVTEIEANQKETLETLKKLDEAEGELQALQSIGHLEAQQALTGYRNTDLLAQQVAMEAALYKSELQSDAEAKAIIKNSGEAFEKYVSSMPDSARK